jgi:hypothetical protein
MTEVFLVTSFKKKVEKLCSAALLCCLYGLYPPRPSKSDWKMMVILAVIRELVFVIRSRRLSEMLQGTAGRRIISRVRGLLDLDFMGVSGVSCFRLGRRKKMGPAAFLKENAMGKTGLSSVGTYAAGGFHWVLAWGRCACLCK